MKKTYTVICTKNKKHKFPVVYEIEAGTEQQGSHPTEMCPFCGTLVEVTIQGKLDNRTVVRRMGFDQ